jgi:hypothetical protein
MCRNRMYATAVGLAALLMAACGGGYHGGDDDDDGVGNDAGAAGDGAPGGPLGELSGDWTFTFTEPGDELPSLTCVVLVAGGGWDVSCPDAAFPAEVVPGCTQLRQDLHLSGTFADALAGAIDNVVEYQGDECAQHGFTTGAPYPTPPLALMTADQLVSDPISGFLSALGGRWVWNMSMVDDPSSQQGCTVDLGLSAQVALAVDAKLDCPLGEPFMVVPDCQEQNFAVLELTLAVVGDGASVLDHMDGTITPETRHTGNSCGAIFPPVERGPSGTLAAVRSTN